MKQANRPLRIRETLIALALIAAATLGLRAQSQFGGVIAQSAESDFRRSLVRVELGFGISGAMLEDRYFPEIEIEEQAEYWGVVIDRRGWIAVHAGGFDLFQKDVKNIQATIRSGHGTHDQPAQLIGIDKRTDLALLHSDGFHDRELPLAGTLDASRLFFAAFSGDQWRIKAHPILALRAEKHLPEATLVLDPSGLGGTREGLVGSFVLNGEGELAGLVARYKPSLSTKNSAAFRILPAAVLLDSARRIGQTHQSIEAGWLGVVPELSQGNVRLIEVLHHSPAERAGLKAGDVLLRAAGQPSQSIEDLGMAIRWKGPGSRLDLTIARAGKVRQLSALLQERQPEQRIWAIDISDGFPPQKKRTAPGQLRYFKTQLFEFSQLGVILEPLSAETAAKYKIPADKGLIIRYLESGSPATQHFRIGDVVVRINDQKLCCASELHSALPNPKSKRMVIGFYRDGELQTVEVNAASWRRSKK